MKLSTLIWNLNNILLKQGDLVITDLVSHKEITLDTVIKDERNRTLSPREVEKISAKSITLVKK